MRKLVLLLSAAMFLHFSCEDSRVEEKLEEKKIFPKIIHNWDRVETNFKLMDLHNTALDDKEVEYVEEILKTPVPDLQTGAFLHHLDQDKIEGVTKNTEGWLENFRGLTTVK